MTGGKLWTIAEASEYLWGSYSKGLRKRTERVIEIYKIPRLKDGRRFYVARSQIERVLAEVAGDR